MTSQLSRTLLAAAAVALAGCASNTEEEMAALPPPVLEGAADTAAYQPQRDTVRAGVDAAPAATTRTFQLAPVRNAEASGTVTLREIGTRDVEVVIDLSGAAVPDRGYAALYRGSCDAPGTVVEALQHVGAEQRMRSTTVLQLPLSQLMSADHVVIVRGDAMGQAEPVACAAIGPAGDR